MDGIVAAGGNDLLDRGREASGDGFTLPSGGDADALAEINRRLG